MEGEYKVSLVDRSECGDGDVEKLRDFSNRAIRNHVSVELEEIRVIVLKSG